MKKWIAVILCFVSLSVLFAGCKDEPATPQNSDDPDLTTQIPVVTEQALRRKQAEMSADRSKRMEQEMARLGGAKPAATQQADSKAFAGYETVVPGTKKRNWGKTILIVVVCLIALIGLLFLIPAPESLQ